MINYLYWELLIRELCRAQNLSHWLAADSGKILICLIFIMIGGACYGLILGIWRAPLQGLFVAIKFPLLLLLTAFGTALVNGMLAQLLNATLNFKQSLLAVLMSFALLSIMLAAFTPLIAFLLWHLPAMESDNQFAAHRIFLLINVIVIAFSGIIANLQLYHLLKQSCGSVAGKILIIWLTLNLFLGAQLSWNLRPFFGAPRLPVTFLRNDLFDGSFYEAIFYLVKNQFI